MEEKKERAIEKAREYFHRDGYRGSSLSALIADIGISKPTFYNYFRNKDDLFSTVMAETGRELHYRYGERSRRASNAMEKLDLFVSTLAWFLDSYPLFRDLCRPGSDLVEHWSRTRGARDFAAESVELVRAILEQGMEDGTFAPDVDPSASAPLLWSMLVTTLAADPSIFSAGVEPSPAGGPRGLVRLLGRGLLTRDAGD